MYMKRDYYVYIHFKKGTNIPFYVGKGTDKRAWSKYSRNKHWKNITKKYDYEVEIVEEGLTNDESLKLENYWYYQLTQWGFELCNINECGLKNPVMVGENNPMYNIGGMLGKTHTEETKNKLSEKNIGENNPMYGKISYWKGKSLPKETKQKISESKKGKYDGINSYEYKNRKTDLPIFIYLEKKSNKNPYYIMYKNKRIGKAPTIEEALEIRNKYLIENGLEHLINY